MHIDKLLCRWTSVSLHPLLWLLFSVHWPVVWFLPFQIVKLITKINPWNVPQPDLQTATFFANVTPQKHTAEDLDRWLSIILLIFPSFLSSYQFLKLAAYKHLHLVQCFSHQINIGLLETKTWVTLSCRASKWVSETQTLHKYLSEWLTNAIP